MPTFFLGYLHLFFLYGFIKAVALINLRVKIKHRKELDMPAQPATMKEVEESYAYSIARSGWNPYT